MEEHGDPVRERVHLVELGRDDEHGHALVPLGDDLLVDELDGPHVHPAGGLGGEEELEGPGELPGDDDLLLVAAGEGLHGGVHGGGADVELLDGAAGVGLDLAQPQGRAAGEAVVAVEVQHEVLGDGERAHEPVRGAVLRDEAHAGVEDLAHGLPEQLRAAQPDRAGGPLPQAEDRLGQLRLAVALHAGHREDLPAGHVEPDVVEQLHAVVRDHGEPGDLQGPLPRLGLALGDGQGHVPAHHEGRELGGRGLRGRLAHHPAPADHRDDVGDRLDLPQLVGDEQDRLPGPAQLAHDLEQLVGLPGREHRGGLVEDEHLRLPHEGLDDLDALLHAHGQVLDHGVRVHVEAVALGDLPDPAAGGLEVEGAAAGALRAEGHVLRDGEHRHQHEVLVHHADPGGHGVPGAPEGHLGAVHQDASPARPVQAVEDVHQGGLARPVLAEEAVDLPGLHDEVDVLVGREGAEPLGDGLQFQLHGGVVLLLGRPPARGGHATAASCGRGPRWRRWVRWSVSSGIRPAASSRTRR